ncbi:hypothetical protein [Catenulispora subtropica]|uniref:Uncharacterized protein n=1 Tax=Catenulispora subtropica TaxID=450798 RepID=A0ABN2TC58_9ACTN
MRSDLGVSEHEPAGADFGYDGVRFRPADADHAPGAPTTVGLYHSRGGELWAEFGGGKVLTGRLVGTTRPDGTIDGAYCQVFRDGQTAAGTLVSVPERLPDGRIRLYEHWRRADGSSGVSVIEQIDAPGDGGPLSSAQVEYLRDTVYRQLQTHLGTAGVLAAARCAVRLLDQGLAGRTLPELTVLVAHDGDEAGAYTLAFVRAMQLVTARVHGETFTLRVVTGDAEPSRIAAGTMDRVSHVLGLHEDPRCEPLAVQGDRVGRDVDVVIGASTKAGGRPVSFSIGADTSYAPDAHRSLLADLLKFEFEEPHAAPAAAPAGGLDDGEDR